MIISLAVNGRLRPPQVTKVVSQGLGNRAGMRYRASTYASRRFTVSIIVLGLGVLVIVASLVLMVRTSYASDLLDKVLDKVLGSKWLYAAALVRLLLGAALIAAADSVRFPALINALGWLMVLGGLLLVVIPPATMERMTGWFGGLSAGWMRMWLLVALLLGLFLVYASLG